MGAGTLNSRITIERKEVTRDSAGQPINEWVAVATIWANIKFPSGLIYSKEMIAADRQTAQTMASMRIRAREIDTAMRIKYRGDVYSIVAVLPDGSRYINLATKKVE